MRAVPLLILALAALPATAEAQRDAFADTTIFFNVSTGGATPTPTASPTPTPTSTPTPTPAGGAPDWRGIIDHCWTFDGNANDTCTGIASAADLTAITTGPTWDTTTKITGSHSASFAIGEGVQASVSLQPLSADNLSMWCFVNLSSVAATGSIMGKWSASIGYELALLVGTGDADLAGQETTRVWAIADIWPTTPTGWSFVWWRARGTTASSHARIGRYSGASTQQIANSAGTAVATDTATPFKIFNGGSGSVAGNVDECGWERTELLDDTALCRICSCGIDGSACVCSGASYTSEGRNDTQCGGCTLPACDAATPIIIAPTPTPSPTPTPTPTPTATPTPAPTAAGSDWTGIVDHCWNFDNNLNDSCTGATAINLAASGSIAYDSSTVAGGSHSMLIDLGEGALANSTSELAPVGGSLAMWCFVNFTSIAANGGIMGKYSTSVGYEISLLSNTGAEDFLGREQNASGSVVNIWSAVPTGWNFVWWRAAATGADSKCKFGRYAGAATQNTGLCGIAATVADASAITFAIGKTTVAGNSAGNYDDCGWEASNIDDAAICKICSCNEDGAACTCSGASYVSEGRNDTHCGGCALPACNLATPGVL